MARRAERISEGFGLKNGSADFGVFAALNFRMD